jgi:hypothetical protein
VSAKGVRGWVGGWEGGVREGEKGGQATSHLMFQAAVFRPWSATTGCILYSVWNTQPPATTPLPPPPLP